MHPVADCNTGFHQRWRYMWTCKGLCGQFYNIHTSQGYVKPIYLLAEHLVICLHLWPWCGTCRDHYTLVSEIRCSFPLSALMGHNHLIHSWEPGPNHCCGCIKGNHYISLVYKTGWKKKKQFSKGPENWVVGAIMQGGEFWCVLLKLV